jgi:hypothetical protein
MDQVTQQFVIEDEESFNDFHDALSDYAPRIEALVALLRTTPDNSAAVADLFRTFHNIKGDASLCRLAFLVPFMHAAETLLARVRAGEVPFGARLADVLLLSIDRLQQAIDALAAREPVDGLHLVELQNALEALHGLPPQEVEGGCQRLIATLTGADAAAADEGDVPDVHELVADRSGDLAFFRELALQLEQRSSLFTGRTDRNLKLALLTNRNAGSPVDPAQLCAAVYLHDIGMLMLPESLWMGGRQLSSGEREQMMLHVGWAAGLLQRMPEWSEAASMVLQHHEKPDGSGYPQGLHGEAIVPGAKILALVDAFEAVMVKQGTRGQARSVLRAAAEVNAAEQQFDHCWFEPFNRAIRHVMEERV